ncbi:MoxR family ATPase [Actinoplanes sp. NPDC051475]|uniref:MoxR family ATPase n=1 Tax=Actinoplanes sp. NPDC051475 TaxID=3157225 RepID=UPI00344E05A8
MTGAVTGSDGVDNRDGRAYAMTDELSLAVDVALATGRPLLLRGDPGSGKSSLAAYVARERGWRYYEHVVTSRTEAHDLLWTFDAVRKLADAQASRVLEEYAYVEPRVLWWAFAPRSAARRGRPAGDGDGSPAADPAHRIHGDEAPSADHAVVLIDEIDKSEPDLPNNLLVPLGSQEFVVTHTGTRVRREPPERPDPTPLARHLVVLTTNEERELPRAFLRRCVVAWLKRPDADRLVTIARMHLDAYDGGHTVQDLQLARAIADQLMEVQADADRAALRAPSTAEFLDALRACRGLGITVRSRAWPQLRKLLMVKPDHPE